MKMKSPLFSELRKSLKSHPSGEYITARMKGRTIVLEKKPRPVSNTTAQQEWRAKYHRAVSHWNALSQEQKEEYNEQAAQLDPPITGFNLYIKNYLLAPEEQRYEYYIATVNWVSGITDGHKQSQAFTVGTVGPNQNHIITKVKLPLYREGTPGTLNVTIETTDSGGLPTGTVLSSGSINGNDLTTSSSGAWYDVEMSSYTLQQSTQYAIVLDAPSAESDNVVYWLGAIFGPSYAGGPSGHYNPNTEEWEEAPNYYNFEEWGQPA